MHKYWWYLVVYVYEYINIEAIGFESGVAYSRHTLETESVSGLGYIGSVAG